MTLKVSHRGETSCDGYEVRDRRAMAIACDEMKCVIVVRWRWSSMAMGRDRRAMAMEFDGDGA